MSKALYVTSFDKKLGVVVKRKRQLVTLIVSATEELDELRHSERQLEVGVDVDVMFNQELSNALSQFNDKKRGGA